MRDGSVQGGVVTSKRSGIQLFSSKFHDWSFVLGTWVVAPQVELLTMSSRPRIQLSEPGIDGPREHRITGHSISRDSSAMLGATEEHAVREYRVSETDRTELSIIEIPLAAPTHLVSDAVQSESVISDCNSPFLLAGLKLKIPQPTILLDLSWSRILNSDMQLSESWLFRTFRLPAPPDLLKLLNWSV